VSKETELAALSFVWARALADGEAAVDAPPGPISRMFGLVYRTFLGDDGALESLKRARRDGTPDSVEELADYLSQYAARNPELADYVLEFKGLLDSRNGVKRVGPDVQDVKAERDAYVAGGDLEYHIHIHLADNERITYDPAPTSVLEPGPNELSGIVGRVIRDLARVAAGRGPGEGTPEPELRRVARETAGSAARGAWWRRRPKKDSGGPNARLRGRLQEQGINPAALCAALSRSGTALVPEQAQDLLKSVLSGREPLSARAEAFLAGLDRQLAPLDSAQNASRGMRAQNAESSTKTQRRRPARSLPPDNMRLTGRETWISDIIRRIRDSLNAHGCATVFMSGQPGVGKSTLAVRTARKLLPIFPGGAFYFDLRGDIETGSEQVSKNIRVSPQRVATDILEIFDRAEPGIGADSPSSDEELFARYAEVLRDQQVLIVLDNAYDISQVKPLLRNVQSSCIIITSRDRSVSVGFLDGAVLPKDVPVLRHDDSTELLLKFARDCDGELQSTVEATRLCERIAYYCADLPLALTLAGEQLRRRLQGDAVQRLRILSQQLKDESKRLGRLGIAPVISLSYLNLDDATRHVFRMSCTTRTAAITAEELAYCIGIQGSAAEDSLSRLVDGSLAAFGADSARRDLTFALYQTTRLFADWRRKEEESPEAVTEFRRRFVDYVRQQVTAPGDGSYPDPDDEFETAGVMTALQLAQENGWLEAGIEIARKLVKVLPVEVEGARLLEAQRILAEFYVQDGQIGEAVDVWMTFARHMGDEGRANQAVSAYRAARDLAGMHGDSLLKAKAAFKLGLLLETCDDLDSAFGAMADSADILLEMRLPGGQQRAIALPAAINCARLARSRANGKEEIHWASAAAGIAEEHRDAAPGMRAQAMHELGLALQKDDSAKAIQSFVTASRWFTEDAQFGNAAIAAENAASLASNEERTRLLRIATERWAQTTAPEDRPRHAAALVKLSAALAAGKDLRGAAETLGEAATTLPDDTQYASQVLEIKMRLAALRLLLGTSSKQVDFVGVRDAGSAVKLSKEAVLLDALSRNALPVADARDALYNFVRDAPRYGPPGHSAWLHDKMGEPTKAK
jgi:NB-ARC domain